MGNRLGLVFAWLAIAIAAIAVSSAAVSSVRSQVTDVPELLGAASFATPVTPPASTPTSVAAITTEPPAEPIPNTTTPTSTTTTSVPSETAITVPPAAPTTTTPTTTTAPTPTTTTTTVFVSTTHTFDTEGGSVIVRVDGDDVTLVSVFAQLGWRYEVKDDGTEQVVVEFEPNDEDDDREIKFEAWVDDGDLEVDIS
jgi:hypothetical protein